MMDELTEQMKIDHAHASFARYQASVEAGAIHTSINYTRLRFPKAMVARGHRNDRKAAQMTLPYFVFQTASLEEVKEYARARLAQLDQTQKVGPDRAATMAGWIVASLLLLNGGAAVAILDSGVHIGVSSPFGILFFSGILVSILNGWLVRVVVARQVAFLSRARAYWSSVLRDGVQIPAEEEALWRLGGKATREGIAMPIPAFLSAVAFGWVYFAMMTKIHNAS